MPSTQTRRSEDQGRPVRPTQPQLAALAQWRALALEQMPYLASILLRLDVWHAPGLGTYAVDERWRLYIDFDHAMTMETVQQGADSLLHECGHILGEHARIARELGVGPREQYTWNVAADCAWNDDLEAAGCVSLRGIWVTPDQLGEPTGRTPQHYYGVLRGRSRQSQQGDQSDADGSGASQPPGQGKGGQSQDGSAPYRGCGSGSGGAPAPCELGDGDASGAPIGDGEAQAILADTARQIVKARGTAPGGMVEDAELMLRPTATPWPRLLSAHVRSASAWVTGQVDQSTARRSRRRDLATMRSLSGGPARRVIRPGWVQPRITVEMIIDTSSSMSVGDVATCRSEVETIARRMGLRGDQLRVTEVDATVQRTVRYRSAKALGGIHGRGGTDMRVGIEAALERRDRADVLIVATDGFTPWPTERTPVPLIALIVGNPGATPPDWVRTVHVDSQDGY